MCERVPLAGGGYAIVCGGHGRGRRRRQQQCSKCGTRTATRLCDGPPEPRIIGGVPATSAEDTCSAPLCDLCAHVRGTGDYCDRCLDKRPRLAL